LKRKGGEKKKGRDRRALQLTLARRGLEEKKKITLPRQKGENEGVT